VSIPSSGSTSPAGGGALRALQVLEALAGMEQPASLAQVAETTRLPTTKAYRSLRALQDHGFVDHLGHRGYRLGGRSVALASLIGPRPALLRAAQPLLHRLAAFVQETSSLHLRSGTHRVLVIGAEARGQALRSSFTIGERAPLTSGCSGTVILAHLPVAEARKITASRPRREKRPSAALLAVIRTDGYAMSFSDNHVGVNGVAAPLLDPIDNYPLGSIAIAGAERRLPEYKLRELELPLRKTCRELEPHLARMLGPNSSERLASLDVTIQDVLEADSREH
jgi:IclR family acetate operon transcriptional repressor